MFCRRAWQRIGPLARSSFTPPCRNAAPVRHMSFGVPGGSTNMTYVILCGGGLTAAVVYAYKTVRGDSERYEDRLANMGSTAKAAAPAAETSPVNEAEPATEVVAESVPAPAEPEAEIAAEVIIEVVAKDTVAVTSEVDVTEAADEPVVKEEAAPSVVLEAAAEDAPVAEEVEASVETQAEALQRRVSPMPDLLTAVKILTGSTVEIAAASVGEKRFVNAAQQIEGDGRGLDSTVEVPQPEILEVTAELTAKEAADGVNEEELRSSEAGAVEEVADADDAEEVIAEETSTAAAAEEEEEAAEPPPEEATGTTQTVGEVGEVEAEDEALDSEAATKEAPSSTKASPEDEATASDEAPPAHDIFMTPAAQTSADEVAAEESAEEMVEAASTRREAAAVVNTTQLAAASTVSNLEVLSAAEAQSDAPLHKAKHCHSCHSAPPAAEEVVPPAAPVGEMCSEGAEDMKLEAKEVALLVEGQKPKVSIWTVKSCSLM
ncbi:hypothetical protein Q5P01_026115 [Channa striata]|uniref:Uncharacterized protein n=1 Tax=Channa striata TaxID=64152 RepID=A0AA88IJK7_CHASR|nr:hypothetical protein Q5P01_026115 [Channa striata]